MYTTNAVCLGAVTQISFTVKPVSAGPSNRSNSVSSLDLEGESVSELGAGPSGSNGVEALQLLEHEQGRCTAPCAGAGRPDRARGAPAQCMVVTSWNRLSSGVSSLGDTQNVTGHNREQPAVPDPVLSGGLDLGDLRRPQLFWDKFFVQRLHQFLDSALNFIHFV